MVSIVLVSHSRELSEAVKALAEQQIQGRGVIAAVGGSDNPFQPYGTDPIAIAEAIESVYSADGVLVLMDLGSAVISGKVARIDPAAVNGNVTVDIRLEGDLPQGARPDLSVDGTVELERLSAVMFVQRPVFGQPNSLIGLFKVGPDGKEANRVQVRIGRVSVQTVEILEGLKVGDKVVLSDMSAWDGQDRLRLN